MAVSARGIGKAGRRWLHLGHRWLGIVTGLFFAMWFASGSVMMYVAYPSLTEPERRAGLLLLAWDRVRITPDAALSGEARFPRSLTLSMRGDEPVYRIVGWDGGRRTVSGVDGRAVAGAGPAEALAIAGRDPRAVEPVFRETLRRDLWSVHQRYDPFRPLHRIALGDPEGTDLYVSEATGAVVLDTTRHERIWNWFGAVPHWIYVTPLRAEPALWRDVVLWLSGVAILAAGAGFTLGLLRLRPRRRFPSGAATPYRGLARWHHLGGVVGGLAVLSFILSGWLSMNPNRWFSDRRPPPEALERYAAPGPHAGLDLAAIRAGACGNAVEVRFSWVGGTPLAVTACRDGSDRPGGDAFSVERLAEAAGRLMLDARMTIPAQAGDRGGPQRATPRQGTRPWRR